MESRSVPRFVKYILILIVAITSFYGLLWLILQGYSAPWTGFADYTKPNSDFVRGKTLWDWIQLFIIPLIGSVGIFLLNRSERETERKRAEERAAIEKQRVQLEKQRAEEQVKLEKQRAEERASLEREIELDRQREASFQSYIDRMSALFLNGDLLLEGKEEACKVARIRTLSILRTLDGQRKGMVMHFLQEAGLLGKFEEKPIIYLRGADLSNANLGDMVDWRGVHLSGVNLHGANLSRANLRGADLSDADLSEANLEGASLLDAFLLSTNMIKANLKHAVIVRTNLSRANLTDADLSDANVNGADLTGAQITPKQLETVEQPINILTMPDGTQYLRQIS